MLRFFGDKFVVLSQVQPNLNKQIYMMQKKERKGKHEVNEVEFFFVIVFKVNILCGLNCLSVCQYVSMNDEPTPILLIWLSSHTLYI